MKVFIINVSTNEIRRNHMLTQIKQNKCLNNYSFVHDGDIEMISPEIMNDFFGGELNNKNLAVVSCAYKHILSYINVVENGHDIALILEDDIFLDDDFCIRINKIISEIKERGLNNFVISLEDSNLKYVKGSKRIKNTFLYKELKGRMAGAYLVDKHSANAMLLEIKQNKCNLPIDWFHNYCSKNELIDIYWSHPTLATQGSLNGKITSLIDNKKYGSIRVFSFIFSKMYRKLLYRLR